MWESGKVWVSRRASPQDLMGPVRWRSRSVADKELIGPTSQLRGKGWWALMVSAQEMCPCVCVDSYVCVLALSPWFSIDALNTRIQYYFYRLSSSSQCAFKHTLSVPCLTPL